MNPTFRATRTFALVGVVITVLAALFAAVGALTGWEPPWGFLAQAVIHLGELAVVIAVALSGAAGRGWLARIGLGAAIIGQVLLVAAELIYPVSPDVGDQIFYVAPLLSAIGLILAGIAVLSARRWSGWRRFTPMLVGLWSLVVLTPALIASGGPPAPLALWAITGWELCWVALGAAVLTEIVVPARRPSTAARVS
ncbi:hypothetical protein Acsp06_65090 [Actinomycetospora sp. NBRC 106375]|uniref:hypothetical protein n=1 Tax=Actinomycetospora sp. NBRC 106375 TaxID=3032207 RepID=UPI0024A1821C|nr:hypothetical protein [Actinomycetospora sp. NBRC 106375]GLZ50324.1 hypothetical protein Acsp06_65090 [Actinomycetospora sp. NBRC 106375]